MTYVRQMPGATPIGQIEDLPAFEQLAVLCLRGLGRGPDLQGFLAREFGPRAADTIVARCDDLAQFITRYAHRPLVRHSPGCDCLGADEAAFAHICRMADQNRREDLLMAAMVLCRADLAPCLLPLAEAFVLSLKQALCPAHAPMRCPVAAHQLH